MPASSRAPITINVDRINVHDEGGRGGGKDGERANERCVSLLHRRADAAKFGFNNVVF